MGQVLSCVNLEGIRALLTKDDEVFRMLFKVPDEAQHMFCRVCGVKLWAQGGVTVILHAGECVRDLEGRVAVIEAGSKVGE